MPSRSSLLGSVRDCTCMQQAQRVPIVPVLSRKPHSDTKSAMIRKVQYAHRRNRAIITLTWNPALPLHSCGAVLEDLLHFAPVARISSAWQVPFRGLPQQEPRIHQLHSGAGASSLIHSTVLYLLSNISLPGCLVTSSWMRGLIHGVHTFGRVLTSVLTRAHWGPFLLLRGHQN